MTKIKKGTMLTSLVGLCLLLSMILSACGDGNTTIPAKSPAPFIDVATLFPTPIPFTTTASATSTPTVAVTTARPVVTPTPPPTKPATTAAATVVGGKLAEGQLFALKLNDNEADLRIDGVEDLTEFKDKPPVGVYKVVFIRIANLGNTSINSAVISSIFNILDSSGRKYEANSSGYSIVKKLSEQDKLKYSSVENQSTVIQPGTIERAILIYDIPKEVTNGDLQLQIRFDQFISKRTPKETSFSAGSNAQDSGAGQELVGQIAAADDSRGQGNFRVKAVERLKEVKGKQETLTPSGVYLVLQMEIGNVGKSTMNTDLVALQDSKGRKFSQLGSGKVASTLRDIDIDKYYSVSYVQPGFTRPVLAVFDIPVDAVQLTLIADEKAKTSRKPTEEAFGKSGGSGADSGAGQELIGTSLTSSAVDYKVTEVKRMNAITSAARPVFNTDGIFVVVAFEVENKGGKDEYMPGFVLKDAEGRSYSSPTYTAINLDLDKQYISNLSAVKPGEKTTRYRIFEIPRDAASLSLALR